MEIALESLAREHVDENTIVVLLLDQAGFRQTGKMTIPKGIEFFPLPPYAPELQPAERLWPCLREAMANRWIRTLDRLEEILTDRIKAPVETPAKVQALTNFERIRLAQNTTN